MSACRELESCRRCHDTGLLHNGNRLQPPEPCPGCADHEQDDPTRHCHSCGAVRGDGACERCVDEVRMEGELSVDREDFLYGVADVVDEVF